MDKQKLERRLMNYSNGASLITSKEFAEFYGCCRERASRKLKDANVDKVSSKWFIPDIVDKIYQGIL